ncbi:prenyltransferase/squalene oxidase repeat-containing protein [Streptomyces gibsoniae]|uniref:Prenyltransferase/squalene oxidase repeat-containing protein n=1 Tax=Streptomyces gibsoniae TaxID=3075529 RepID=A0ABU2TKI1_9ACTN|nr:prenyltransferase/squalene oxidase repeat-containing protein [Streptomyces sp. DSM 41699]MDT0461439.1 prenyltransferase/squalene oxidase repeat-containing protein [Streptomyces sp. DSM 41699]
MIVRRSAAVLAAIAAVAGAPATAFAASPAPSASPSLPSGLYGSGDPTYDGVWRQSLALLAQHTAGVRPATAAVDWLTGQQCATGAFAPYRAQPSAKCDAKTPVDTNNTAAAVQALAALGGHGAESGKAVAWLKSVQNKDGGWGYTAGGASDANSTSVVIGALAAAGEQPQGVRKDGKSPYDALLKLALPCDGDGAGAFAYQPDKKGALTANADATAAAVTGALGKGFGGEKAPAESAAPACAKASDARQAAHNGAAYLLKALAKDQHLTSALPGAKDQPDYGNTADAVVALATVGQGERASGALHWLQANSGPWAKQSGPAAYAQLILAAHATGTDPRHFGGTDLVSALDATGPAPQAAGATPKTEQTQKPAKKDHSGSAFGVWWIVGVFLVAGIGIGFLLSGRGKRQQP